MRDTWANIPLPAKLRFLLAMAIAFGALIGTLVFLAKQEGLVAAVAGMLAGIPAVTVMLKRYNQQKAEGEASRRRRMPITITRVDQDSYTAHVTPPHGDGTEWQTQEPMTRPELYNELVKLGCHRVDVADALDEADRAWPNKAEST